MVIGIIGGGASGMAAALAAAENRENKVILFERQARVGRKLQATGNGRCNLSNLNAGISFYHGENPCFSLPALNEFSVEQTISWFQKMGLYTVTEPSGRVYPYSDQANSVVDVLRFSLERENIQLMLGCEVTRTRKSADGFAVEISDGSRFCDRLIIACGGLAGTRLGGSMAGYQFLRGFGHHCTRLRPSLVQLKSSWKGCVGLKGVRCHCHVQIFCGDMLHLQSSGELQFTEYGLSGPVIFEVSRDTCQTGKNWTARLDFLPGESRGNLLKELARRAGRALPAEELLTGMLHNRLGKVLLQAAGIRFQRASAELTDGELQCVCDVIKAFEVPLTEAMGMDNAQVTAGGCLTAEFDSTTMESRLVPGLYACGEVLDIDGDCGGFNLQWAWSSGRLAGRSAGGGKV